MKFLNLKGKEINIDIRPSTYPIKAKSKSKLQGLVGLLIQEKYKNILLLEEFQIPQSRYSLDFFAPHLRKAWEIDGIGHLEYTSWFHGSKLDNKFMKQLQRDEDKTKWCEINNIELVRITEADKQNIKDLI